MFFTGTGFACAGLARLARASMLSARAFGPEASVVDSPSCCGYVLAVRGLCGGSAGRSPLDADRARPLDGSSTSNSGQGKAVTRHLLQVPTTSHSTDVQQHEQFQATARPPVPPLQLLPPRSVQLGRRSHPGPATPCGLPESLQMGAGRPQPLTPPQQPLSSMHQGQQVRCMSWRRWVPSGGDLWNAVEGPHRQMVNLFLAINVATYIVTKFDRSIIGATAAIPQAIAAGEVHRLLTSGFLHTDFLHLLSNCLALHWLGPNVESACGRGRFALIYLSAVVSGSWLQYSMSAYHTVAWGASGGVCGLFSAYLVYRLRNRAVMPWDSHETTWVAQIVGLNVLLGLAAGGHIGHWAHLGGLLGGAAAMWLTGPRYVWRGGYVEDRPILPWFRK